MNQPSNTPTPSASEPGWRDKLPIVDIPDDAPELDQPLIPPTPSGEAKPCPSCGFYGRYLADSGECNDPYHQTATYTGTSPAQPLSSSPSEATERDYYEEWRREVEGLLDENNRGQTFNSDELREIDYVEVPAIEALLARMSPKSDLNKGESI